MHAPGQDRAAGIAGLQGPGSFPADSIAVAEAVGLGIEPGMVQYLHVEAGPCRRGRTGCLMHCRHGRPGNTAAALRRNGRKPIGRVNSVPRTWDRVLSIDT